MQKILDMIYLFSAICAGLAIGTLIAIIGIFMGMVMLIELPTKVM